MNAVVCSVLLMGVVLATAAPPENDDAISISQKLNIECMKELGITDDVMKTEDLRHKAEMEICAIKKRGMITDGKFTPDKAIASAASWLKSSPAVLDDFTKAMEYCRTKDITGATDMELIQKIAQCLEEHYAMSRKPSA